MADGKPAEERKTREERKKRFEGREGEIEKGNGEKKGFKEYVVEKHTFDRG